MIRYRTTDDDVQRLAEIRLAQNVQPAVQSALATWAADRQGLGGRLAASSWALYGWTRRSPGYQAKQAKSVFGVLPYVSPRTSGYKGIGKFLHALTKPGRGHNVYAGPVTDRSASADLTVRAARGLNFLRNAGTYLDEWSRMHPADVAGIEPHLARLADAALQKAVDPHG